MRLRILLCAAALIVLTACGATTTRTVTSASPGTSPSTATSSKATSAATTTATAATPVYFQGAAGPAAQRPSALQLTGDGTLEVAHVQWTSWGGPDAMGTGAAIFHGCTPNCAAAPVHTAVVSVHLSDVRVCSGRRYYSGVSLTLSSGLLLDKQFLQRSWSPC